jgi:MFS family permease
MARILGAALTSVPLRRNREFMLLWSGQTLSTLGTQVSSVAYPLLVLALTGSAAKAGIVGFATNLPCGLCALPAGALADRLNQRGAIRQLVPVAQLSDAAAQNESRTFGAMLAGPRSR